MEKGRKIKAKRSKEIRKAKDKRANEKKRK